MPEPRMRDLVRQEMQRLAENAEVAQDYPELNDQGSEFFRETAFALGRLPEGTPDRVRLAASKVEVQMRREGRWKEPARAPAGGARQQADGELSATQENVAAEIIGGDRAEAIAAYRERANQGVNVSLGGRLAGHLERER